MRVLTSAKQYSNLLTAGSIDGRFVLSAQSAEAPGESVKRKQEMNKQLSSIDLIIDENCLLFRPKRFTIRLKSGIRTPDFLITDNH
jgi:hypothetical protein